MKNNNKNSASQWWLSNVASCTIGNLCVCVKCCNLAEITAKKILVIRLIVCPFARSIWAGLTLLIFVFLYFILFLLFTVNFQNDPSYRPEFTKNKFALCRAFSQNWAQHYVGDENYYTKRISDGLINIELWAIGEQEVWWPGRGLYWRLTQCWVMIALQPCELWCRYLFFSLPGLFCLPDLLHSDLWRQQAGSKLKSLFSVRRHHWKGANCSSMSCSNWMAITPQCVYSCRSISAYITVKHDQCVWINIFFFLQLRNMLNKSQQMSLAN